MIKIGLQMYTVRKMSKKDLYGTLKAMAGEGFKYVEASRVDIGDQGIDAFKRAADDFGMQVEAVQLKYSVLDEEFSKVVKFLKAVKCGMANISVLPTEYIVGNNLGLLEFSKKVNALSMRYADKGVTLAYHHHDMEFFKEGESVRFDIMRENFSPDVRFIIDTYWATKGGFAAYELIKSLDGRVGGLHLRDYVIKKSLLRLAKDVALGDGVVDFKRVIEAAEACGAKYAAIEQKTSEPVKELRKSIKRLEQLGFVERMK